MTARIVSHARTPEVEAILAYLKWHLVTTELDIEIGNLRYTRGGGRPNILFDNQVIVGFDALYKYIQANGLCAI